MPQFTIKSFSGGQSEFDDKGISGSFKFGKNLDIRKRKDTLSCGQAVVKDSGTIAVDLILNFVEAESGNVYGFGDSGKIYKRTADGVWSVAHTDTGKVKGAGFWYKLSLPQWKGAWSSATTYAANDSVSYQNAYYFSKQANNLNKNPATETDWWGVFTPSTISQIYWVAQDGVSDWLRRISPAGTWATDIENIDTLTQVDWHPIKSALGYLWIGNEKNIATVDYDGNFTKGESRFNIYPRQVVKSLIEYKDTLLAGSYHTSPYRKLGGIWQHIYSQVGYQKRKEVAENINAMVETESILSQAGTDGEIYEIDFVKAVPKCRIPGGGYSNPQAVLNDEGAALFGISGGENNGIWSFGRKTEKADRVLNYEYAFTADEVGAITKIGNDILISYKNGGDSGVLKIDLTKKATAVYEGLILKAPPHYIEPVVWEAVKITLDEEIPTGASIGLEFKVDGGDWTKAYLEGGEEFMESGVIGLFQVQSEGKSFEVRPTLVPVGNLTPEVKQIDIFFT